MKTFEFQAPVSPSGTLTLPEEVASQVPAGQTVRVVLVVEDDRDEEREWIRMGMEHFFKEDDPGDALYNDVPVR
jgi:hypothetical protein